ncbi:unnamed protein product [Effrenium voratum]|nr:unnamed protein product [Effrenium voratum]
MARVEQWQAEDPETTQDIAETRKLVQLAAQRCIELRTAVELAKADYQGRGAQDGRGVGPPSRCMHQSELVLAKTPDQ